MLVVKISNLGTPRNDLSAKKFSFIGLAVRHSQVKIFPKNSNPILEIFCESGKQMLKNHH